MEIVHLDEPFKIQDLPLTIVYVLDDWLLGIMFEFRLLFSIISNKLLFKTVLVIGPLHSGQDLLVLIQRVIHGWQNV